MGKRTANVNIRVDPELKSAVEEVYAQFGITLGDAVNIFFRKSLMEGGLPFEMRLPKFNPSVEAAMMEAKRMEGKSEEKIYNSWEEYMNDPENNTLNIEALKK